VIAVVAGGTGLIGSFLLRHLDDTSEIEEVRALTRREKKGIGKISWKQIDFSDGPALAEVCKGADLAFCCLGTTMKNAGSKEAFRRVDHDYVVGFAKAAKRSGINSFSVISAIGSDPHSSIFYNRVKGEMEKDLEQIGFANLQIFQPSILMGPREENRLGERLGIIAMRAVSPLLLGNLRKYKPVKAETVAKAMLDTALNGPSGTRRFTYADFNKG